MRRTLRNLFTKHESGGARSARPARFVAARYVASVACVLFFLSAATSPAALGQENPFVDDELAQPETWTAYTPLPLDYLDVWSTHRPRFSFVHDAGRRVGYRDSFTSLEFFVPLARPDDCRLWFADLRGIFVHEGAVGGNFGVGRRQYIPGLCGTLGTYLYYDYRETDANEFQQISPGVELLTQHWDLRINGYLPTVFDERQAAPHQFRNHFLYIDRFETAMSGADLELSAPLPLLHRFQPKVGAGCYYFSGPQRGSFWGWRARVEGHLTDAVSLRLAVQDDERFDTTVSFAVAIRFPGGALLNSVRWPRCATAFWPVRRGAVPISGWPTTSTVCKTS